MLRGERMAVKGVSYDYDGRDKNLWQTYISTTETTPEFVDEYAGREEEEARDDEALSSGSEASGSRDATPTETEQVKVKKYTYYNSKSGEREPWTSETDAEATRNFIRLALPWLQGERLSEEEFLERAQRLIR